MFIQAVIHNTGMATLQQKIAETFLAKLADAKEIDADKLDKIKALLLSRHQ